MQEELEVVRVTCVPVMCPHGPGRQCRGEGLPHRKEAGSHSQGCSSGAAWLGSDLPITGSMQAEAERSCGWNSHSGASETGSSSEALLSLTDTLPACPRVW